MCCKSIKPKKKTQRTSRVIFNPYPRQEYVTYGNMIAVAERVKQPEKGNGLTVVNWCQVT